MSSPSSQLSELSLLVSQDREEGAVHGGVGQALGARSLSVNLDIGTEDDKYDVNYGVPGI